MDWFDRLNSPPSMTLVAVLLGALAVIVGNIDRRLRKLEDTTRRSRP